MLTLNQFTETIDRLEEARILMASLEFKIFSILQQKSMTAKQVAQKSKTKHEEMVKTPEPPIRSHTGFMLSSQCLIYLTYRNQ